VLLFLLRVLDQYCAVALPGSRRQVKTRYSGRGRFRRHWPNILVPLTLAVMVGGDSFGLAPSKVNVRAAETTDLSQYYPDMSTSGAYYLEGPNYRRPSSPTDAVLWFEVQDNASFKQYNSGPASSTSRCHWDQLRWSSKLLTYSETRDQCQGVDNDIVYSPAIAYMPKDWDGQPWSLSGSSNAVYHDRGSLVCQGTSQWLAEVVRDFITPGAPAIHVRATITTSWSWGTDPSGCGAGSTTHWQEDYYLRLVPIAGSTLAAPALTRTVGGNLDTFNRTGVWDWDIWFDHWQQLPSQGLGA
jgi:hypothetical protein